MKKLGRRILTLALALILAAAPLTAAADVWIPPDDGMNETLVDSVYQSGECKTLNAFVSNYAEANVKYFDSETPDSVAIAGTLKHLELNAGLFGADVTKITGEDGNTYMKVSASVFETRVQKLYGRKIPAEACPGYRDGYIIVSAENYGGPIRVFACVDFCIYLGDYIYEVGYTVYYVSAGVTNEYSLTSMEIWEREYQELGTGCARFYFADTEKTSFRTADLQLIYQNMDVEGIPCTNQNLPATQTEQPTEPTGLPGTEPEATQPPAQSAPGKLDPPPDTTEEESDPTQQPSQGQSQDSGSVVMLIILAVLAVALLALAGIAVIFSRKKE